jgi:hypothetical protein
MTKMRNFDFENGSTGNSTTNMASKDTLEDYFSSSRHGEDTTNTRYSKGTGNASITFANAEGRKNKTFFMCYCWVSA